MRIIGSITSLLIILSIWGCQWGPKEKEIIMPGFHGTGKAFDSDLFFDLHRVKAIEIIPSDSYVYLKVSESEREFWIATRPAEYHLDSIYFYREALLKTEFKSKQLNREFDSIYLVTKLVSELDHTEQLNH